MLGLACVKCGKKGLGDDTTADLFPIFATDQSQTGTLFDWSTLGTTPSSGAGVPSISNPSTTSTNFWSALSAGLTNASKILSTRYSVPQLNPGQAIQSTPYGTIMTQSATGVPSLTVSPFGLTGSSSWLVIGGIAVVGILLLSRASH